MSRRLIRMVAVCLLLVMSIGVAQPTVAKPAGDGPGNSANAKMCQKGGWQSLARQGSSGVAFANQGECVSYGAQGGVIVNHRTISVTWENTPDGSAHNCVGYLTFTGFEPGTYPYSVRWYGGAGGSLFGNVTVVNNVPIDVVLAASWADPHEFIVEDLSVQSVTDCPKADHPD